MAEEITAIIPAHNESDIIGDTVRAVLSIPGNMRVIVVDDASTDDTAPVARAAGAHEVIVLTENAGKGGALNAAIPHVSGDIVLLLDADLGASAVEAEKLLSPVTSGEADMVVALFTGGRAEGTKLAAKSGGFGTVVKVARFGIRLLTGKDMRGPIVGQRALKREIIERTGGFASRFGVEVGLTIDALRMGYRVVEVPVGMVHRASGRDFRGFMHRGRQLMDVLGILVKKACRR